MNEPRTVYDVLYAALLVGLWWIKLTCQLYRRTRYLEELLRREQRRNIERHNAMQRRLLEAFLRAPTPTLRQLVDDTETESEMKP